MAQLSYSWFWVTMGGTGWGIGFEGCKISHGFGISSALDYQVLQKLSHKTRGGKAPWGNPLPTEVMGRLQLMCLTWNQGLYAKEATSVPYIPSLGSGAFFILLAPGLPHLIVWRSQKSPSRWDWEKWLHLPMLQTVIRRGLESGFHIIPPLFLGLPLPHLCHPGFGNPSHQNWVSVSNLHFQAKARKLWVLPGLRYPQHPPSPWVALRNCFLLWEGVFSDSFHSFPAHQHEASSCCI